MELRHVFNGILLIAGTVAIHSAGTFLLLWPMLKRRSNALQHLGFLPNTLRLILVVVALLVIHLLEAALWALFYDLKKCFPDWPTSIYFSLDTYTTVGHGDVLLDKYWRLLGGIEALTGVIMISWSTALLIGLLNWIYTHTLDRWGLKKSEA